MAGHGEPGAAYDAYEWTAHPLRERRAAGLAGAAAILAVALAAAQVGGTPWWGGAAALALVAALRRFYLPSRFRMDAEGITARLLLHRRLCRWNEVRRFVHDRHGGYLSHRPRASLLDPWGGMHVLFGGQRQRVLEQIRARLPASSGAAPAGGVAP